ELLCFQRTARRIVFRIEIHDGQLTSEITQSDRSGGALAAQVGNGFAERDHQYFIGSMIASRLRPSQNSRKSSRKAAMCVFDGMPIVICAENMSAPVCIAR